MVSYKKILAIVIVLFVGIMFSYSQESENYEAELNSLSLTQEQKVLLKEQILLRKQIRESIKNNLSADQKRILANKNLSKTDRAKLLKKSLSTRQLSELKYNRNLLKDKRMQFRKTISKRQMVRLKHFIRDKKIRDKKRLVRRLRQLIRQNIDQ